MSTPESCQPENDPVVYAYANSGVIRWSEDGKRCSLGIKSLLQASDSGIECYDADRGLFMDTGDDPVGGRLIIESRGRILKICFENGVITDILQIGQIGGIPALTRNRLKLGGK